MGRPARIGDKATYLRDFEAVFRARMAEHYPEFRSGDGWDAEDIRERKDLREYCFSAFDKFKGALGKLSYNNYDGFNDGEVAGTLAATRGQMDKTSDYIWGAFRGTVIAGVRSCNLNLPNDRQTQI